MQSAVAGIKAVAPHTSGRRLHCLALTVETVAASFTNALDRTH